MASNQARPRRARVPRVWLALAAVTLLPSCATFFPGRTRLADRLAVFPTAGLPLRAPVTVRWNDFGVPWVEATDDRDAAFTLGMVQAHYREGLLAVAKRIVQGRLSEIAGPFAWDLDTTLRILDFPKAAADIEAAMPDDARTWTQAFADGLNWYQDHVKQTPPEYALLGISRERWTVRDLIALGRLAGTDINWLTYFGLSRDRLTDDWPEVWDRVRRAGDSRSYSFRPDERMAVLRGVLEGMSRSGSNCWVVSPRRSATGAALLASDPHLALLLPNLWVLAGVRSPSYEVVGLMPAGLPVFGLGRTRAMAWGGTNMRAAASDLYDVSSEPLTERTAHLSTRLWRGKDVTLHGSAYGNLISDSPLFASRPGERIALRWMGHETSDDVTAFLRVLSARGPADFRTAFRTYAVGGQNMQFATSDGHIGQVMAAWLPRRSTRAPETLVLDPRDPRSAWDGHEDSTTLPWTVDPPEGFLASANNPATVADVPIGYFFITSERVRRLQQMLAANGHVTVDDLSAMQRDVTSPASIGLRDALLARIDAADAAAGHEAFVARLRGWDGAYTAESAGPVAFETLLYWIATPLSARRPADRRLASDWSWIVDYLAPALDGLPEADRAALLRGAVAKADADAAKFPDWGSMHTMRVQPVLGAIPVIGGWFRVTSYPSGGSRETAMKAAHGLVHDRHAVSYGSQSRFVADMGDPDNSWFVLFGGEDGRLGSENFADMVPLWREGRSIRMPLRPETVAAEFPHVTVLRPAGGV